MNTEKMDLIGLFGQMEWLLHRYYHQHRVDFGPMGKPRRGQGRVLSILKMKPEITQKELTDLLDMRPQSLGELLNRMEQNGYITRTSSEKDRRVIDIKLTEAGMDAANQDQQPDFNEIFDGLSTAEQNTLSEYLYRIIDSLEQKLEADQTAKDFDGYSHKQGWGHHSGYGHTYGHGGWTGADRHMDQDHSRFGDFPHHGKHQCRKQSENQKEDNFSPDLYDLSSKTFDNDSFNSPVSKSRIE